MAIDTQDHRQTVEEALRAENARLHTELERLRRERPTTMAAVAAIAREQERIAQERAAELASVNAILQNCLERLSASDGPEAFLAHILTEIARAIKASSLFLFRYNPVENRLALHLSYLNGMLRSGPCGDEFSIFAAPFPADITPAFAVMCRERRFFTPANSPIPVEEFAWPGVMEELARRNPSDVAHLALLVGETPVGSLGFEFQDGKRLREADQPLVMALAQQAAIALRLIGLAEQERLTTVAREQEKAAHERAKELAKANEALQRSVAQLTGAQDVNNFIDSVLLSILQQTGGSGGALFTYDPATDTARMKACVLQHTLTDIATDPRLEMWRRPCPMATFAEGWKRMLAAPEGYFIEDIQPDEVGMVAGAAAWHIAQGHRSIAHFPLLCGEVPVGFIGIVFSERIDMTPAKIELARALAQQATLALELMRLSGAAQQAAVAQERNRLAQEIHDTLAHSFNSIKFLLEATETMGKLPAGQTEVITRARELASEGAREARRSVWSLRPEALERGNLLSALSEVIRQRTQETMLHIELRVEGEPFPLRPEVEDNLLRVVQEALANVINHAQANRVDITLFYSTPKLSVPELTLCIRDDGIGFVLGQTKGGTRFGLRGMRERLTRLGGQLKIVSAPGAGTEIRATISDAQR